MQFSMLIVNTNRSKAYLQNLLQFGYIPNKVLVLDENSKDNLFSEFSGGEVIKKMYDLDLSFDENEHVITTLKKNHIKYAVLPTLDVNSYEVANEVSALEEEYIIYSGRGGAIINKEILSLGKKFIHVHSGWLPEYRGSTTMYYSLLIDSDIACSVIILDSKIDTGDILFRKKYAISNKEYDYDFTVDPIVRADTLISFLQEKDQVEPIVQTEKGNTFYIIHPVLKNLSILKHSRKLEKSR